MPGEEGQDLNPRGCDDKWTDNLEVGSRISQLDSTTQVPGTSSDITDQNLHHHDTEGIEADPNYIINVEELSHEPLGKCSREYSECKVNYGFPSDDESDNRPAKDCGIFHHASFHTTCSNQYPAITQVEQKTDLPIEVFDKKKLNKEVINDACVAGTSGEEVRKRKNRLNFLVQNKRHKEVKSSRNPMTEDIIKSSDNTSDGFGDIEDNVKDSSSFETCDWNSTDEKAKQTPVRHLDFQHRNATQNETAIGDKPIKVIHEHSSSDSNISKNNKAVEEKAEKTVFLSSLKGETLSSFKLTDEAKEKFKLSVPSVLEAQESESVKHVFQPRQSKTNSLKMKSKVGKRKDKCNVCNVRLGLCAIQCRCEGYYCAKHRYDREHNCTYDYRSMGATEIQKNNPRIVAEKVRKL